MPALGCGRRDLTDASADEDQRTLTILRRDGKGSAAAVLINLSDAERPLEIAGGPEGGWRLALATRATDGAVPTQVSGAQLRVAVPPRTALIYVGER